MHLFAKGVGHDVDVALDVADAVTQKFAFMGRTGSGKSYAAGTLTETFLADGHQLVVVDPVGIWWALRVCADGKAPFMGTPVLGGQYGDVALTPASGALVARVLVERRTSAVLDVSDFRVGEQRAFMTAFSEELFHLKKRSRSPMHLLLEEAHEFAPQVPQKGEERMLSNVERLARLGRNYGIGLTLISQRPQAVSKAVLNQTEVLCALQLNGAHERKAIADWVKEKGVKADVVADLPKLQVGEALIWSPQWLKLFVRAFFPEKLTFDASATPSAKTAASAPPAPLSPADLSELRAAMNAAEKEAADADPKKLRARVVELEEQLRTKTSAIELGKIAVGKMAEAGVSKLDDLEKQVARRDEIIAEAMASIREKNAQNEQLRVELGRARGNLERVRIAVAGCVDVANATVVGDMLKSRVPDEAKIPPLPLELAPLIVKGVGLQKLGLDKALDAKGTKLKKGAREILRALAAARTTLSRDAVATLAGLSPRSGTFSDYLSALRSVKYIATTSGGPIAITELGRVAAGAVNVARSPDEVLALWEPKLKAGARRMLRVVIGRGAAGVTREQLGHEAGVSPTSGTFSDYMSKLRSCALIVEEGRVIKPATSLAGASVRV